MSSGPTGYIQLIRPRQPHHNKSPNGYIPQRRKESLPRYSSGTWMTSESPRYPWSIVSRTKYHACGFRHPPGMIFPLCIRRTWPVVPSEPPTGRQPVYTRPERRSTWPRKKLYARTLLLTRMPTSLTHSEPKTLGWKYYEFGRRSTYPRYKWRYY